jgi:hypothetical protein
VIDEATAGGVFTWELFDEHGQLKASGRCRNLWTQVGDRMYAERGAGISGAPAIPTGMKLGTGSTAPAKTGAGAALDAYLPNSHQPFDSTYPQSSLSGSARRITYRCTFPAGKATSASPITEAVLVNETLGDTTSGEANTVSRVLVTGVPAKGAAESLVASWTHDLQGT